MEGTALAWLAVGWIGGGIAAGLFRMIMVWKWELGLKPSPNLGRVPGWVTGVVERTWIMGAVWIEVPDVATAAMAWLGLKLAANWARFDSDARPKAHTWAMLALLCGLISVGFAFVGITMTRIALPI